MLDLTDSRDEVVGRFRVRRALPTRGRRTVGAWCFADHLGPADVTASSGLDVGPHPHMGLQTVTWLTSGEALHRDSLGSEQLIAPGQLNLMTAGHGVAHSEEATGRFRGTVEGIQLWIAQPEATRHGPAAFEHHGELPRTESEGAVATVLVGGHDGVVSPARHDTELVGMDLQLHGTSTLPLRPDFEYALVVLAGTVGVAGHAVTPGMLGYLGAARDELTLVVDAPARLILLGGVPFGTSPTMWWNYVGRTRDEIDEAHRSWTDQDGRFGTVDSALPVVMVDAPWWQRRPGA